MSNVKLYLKNIALPLGIGIVIGLLTMGGMEDFKLLSKPLLNPPSIVFPIVWTILYILMGISYTLLLTSGTNTKETKMAYFLQLFFNALWPILFFTLKWRLIALIWLIVLDILVLNMVIKFIKHNKLSGIIQIPYLLWVLFATYLNWAIYLLNR